MRLGSTLVEVLVVFGILGLLFTISTPAVQSAREAARQAQCRNHVRQLSVAVANFESSMSIIPGNGWGYAWVGDSSRGPGTQQPGGWLFQLLPFLDQSFSGHVETPGMPSVNERLCTLRVPVLDCPSRPGGGLAPRLDGLVFHNASPPASISKTDYAINEGDWITDTPAGPMTYKEGDSRNYLWTDVRQATGVSFLRSAVRMADISDGASNTYLLGEKAVSTNGYDSAEDSGHDAPFVSGVDLDVNRWTIDSPTIDSGGECSRQFGSAHSAGCMMAMCDGSVRCVSYFVDPLLHRRLGNRRDGKSTSEP